jgi:hypothetical protein
MSYKGPSRPSRRRWRPGSDPAEVAASSLRRRLAAALLLVALLPSAALAQSVLGRVIDGVTGTPVPQAVVALQADGRTVGGTLADTAGYFSIVLPGADRYTLRITGRGYEAFLLEGVQLSGPGAIDISQVALRPLPFAMDEILVEVRRGALPPKGQDRVLTRQLLGQGTFIPGAMIAVENPVSLTAYLAEKADLWVKHDQYGRPYLWSPVGPHHCLTVQVNQWPLEVTFYRSLEEIRYGRIAAVEIYNTPADLPPEPQILDDTQDDRQGRCGLVNIWTWNAW